MLTIAGIGIEPLIIILVIVLVLIGGSKIPELLRGVGRGIGELQKGLQRMRANDETTIEQRKRLARGLARKARRQQWEMQNLIRTGLGLPPERWLDDDDDDDDWPGGGGSTPPPSAVRIW